MLNTHFRKGALALTLAGFTGVALATVTFYPSNGTGFVGKGDLQIPWGWNNQKLQMEAN